MAEARYFGERALLTNEGRAATIKAMGGQQFEHRVFRARYFLGLKQIEMMALDGDTYLECLAFVCHS